MKEGEVTINWKCLSQILMSPAHFPGHKVSNSSLTNNARWSLSHLFHVWYSMVYLFLILYKLVYRNTVYLVYAKSNGCGLRCYIYKKSVYLIRFSTWVIHVYKIISYSYQIKRNEDSFCSLSFFSLFDVSSILLFPLYNLWTS